MGTFFRFKGCAKSFNSTLASIRFRIKVLELDSLMRRDSVKVCLLAGKHLWKAVGWFPFLTYLCGTWEFVQVCIWVVLVLWQWLGCCCCCRQKEEVEQTVPSQGKLLKTKREIVFVSNTPFCDERRLLRHFQVVLFKESSWISSLYFRTGLLLTSDKFPCSRLTMHSLRNRIIFYGQIFRKWILHGREKCWKIGRMERFSVFIVQLFQMLQVVRHIKLWWNVSAICAVA